MHMNIESVLCLFNLFTIDCFLCTLDKMVAAEMPTIMVYGLPVKTRENCKNFKFFTDYGKTKFFYSQIFFPI